MISGKLIAAIAIVESGGDPNAVGQNGEVGILQIRQCVLDDVNEACASQLTLEDVKSVQMSRWVCRAYINFWATRKRLKREPTDQDRARIWNGGPDGWRELETVVYWKKVQTAMQKLEW